MFFEFQVLFVQIEGKVESVPDVIEPRGLQGGFNCGSLHWFLPQQADHQGKAIKGNLLLQGVDLRTDIALSVEVN
jgi:hypothetical protein